MNANTDSSFVYIRFTYQQLGSSEEYFKEMVRDLQKDWAAIRREVLLEWSETSDNSPFSPHDLDQIAALTMKEPIRTIIIRKAYAINIYKTMENYHYPPIIGVDVSGGYSRDSSAITIIDSKTTDVIADFNCNYISTNDLAHLIYELVVAYMPNAIVNIERNGGFGASVLATLIKTKIKRNLYYEIKDRVEEERVFGGMNIIRKNVRKKVYGFDETKKSRELLMEILRERVENHKSKFISPIILSELRTLEVKKNGRIEHSINGHDDQIFSYLMALYVWYEGKDLTERYGLEKTTIYSDDDSDNALEYGITENYEDISESFREDDGILKEQMDILNSDKTILYDQWQAQERAKDKAAVDALLRTKIGREAYINEFHIDPEELPMMGGSYTIPNSVFDDYYSDFQSPEQKKIYEEQQRMSKILNMKF